MSAKGFLQHYQQILNNRHNPQAYQYILIPSTSGLSSSDVLHFISPLVKPPLHPSIARNVVHIHGPTSENYTVFQHLRRFSIPADHSPTGEKVNLESRWVAEAGCLEPTVPTLRISNINLPNEDAIPIVQQILTNLNLNAISIQLEFKEGVPLATFLASLEEPSKELLSLCSFFQYQPPRYDRNSWWLSPVDFCTFCGLLLHRGVKHSCEGKEHFTSSTNRKPRSRATSRQLSINQSRHASPPRMPEQSSSSQDKLLLKVATQLQSVSSSDPAPLSTPIVTPFLSSKTETPTFTHSTNSTTSSSSSQPRVPPKSTITTQHKPAPLTISSSSSSTTKPLLPTPPTPPKTHTSKNKH
jgi:hypothetical protein